MNFKKIIFISGLLFSLVGSAQTNLLEKAKSFEQPDSSIYYAEKFLVEAHSKKDTQAVMKAGVFLSTQYLSVNKCKEAETMVMNTLVYVTLTKSKVKEAILSQVLAKVYENTGQNKKALRLLLKALDLFDKIKNSNGILSSLVNLAEFNRRIRQFEEAKSYIERGFRFCETNAISDTTHLIGLNNRMAAIMIESGNADSCIYYSKKAIDLCQKTRNISKEAVSLNELGFAYKNINQPDSAIFYYKKAEKIWASLGDEHEVLNVMKNRAMVYSQYRYPKKLILQSYLEILARVKLKKLDVPLEDVYSYLSLEYLTAGDTGRSYVYLKNYYETRIEVLKKIYDADVNEVKEKYENDKIKKDFSQVTSKLEKSEIILNQKRREAIITYSFISALLLLILFVIYLLIQRNKSNKILKEKNSEKDTLIQEIHHRVKNNLQFVSSLINMQINSSDNSAEAHSLNDASRRIKAMALVHEMLYSQNEIQGIYIHSYLIELTDSINELVNSARIPIQFKVDAGNIVFDTQRAIAIGMITSELVSNSIKYAFSNTEQPVIKINLSQKKDHIIYSVEDNGIGFVQTNEQRKTLGMRLISIFSRQLKGEYNFETTHGYKYTVTFKY